VKRDEARYSENAHEKDDEYARVAAKITAHISVQRARFSERGRTPATRIRLAPPDRHVRVCRDDIIIADNASARLRPDVFRRPRYYSGNLPAMSAAIFRRLIAFDVTSYCCQRVFAFFRRRADERRAKRRYLIRRRCCGPTARGLWREPNIHIDVPDCRCAHAHVLPPRHA